MPLGSGLTGSLAGGLGRSSGNKGGSRQTIILLAKPTEISVAGTGSLVVPDFAILAEIWLIGGGGGATLDGGTGYAGGGGAAAIRHEGAVTPGASLIYSIGGPGGSGLTSFGGDTTLQLSDILLIAKGGQSSQAGAGMSAVGGQGGKSAQCIGQQAWSGGDGGSLNAGGLPGQLGGAGSGNRGGGGAGSPYGGAGLHDNTNSTRKPGAGGGGSGQSSYFTGVDGFLRVSFFGAL